MCELFHCARKMEKKSVNLFNHCGEMKKESVKLFFHCGEKLVLQSYVLTPGNCTFVD